jgi:hypothetical protein
MTKWDNGPLSNLNEVLANLYPMDSDARRMALKSNLPLAHIQFENKAINTWFNVLYFANQRDKVDDVVANAIEENPGDEALLSARERQPPPVVKGPEAKAWSGPSAAASLEKLMGAESTLVPITYLEMGLARARSVVRVKRDDGSSGTGFITAGGVLITNNHVLPDAAAAGASVVQFNYQQTVAGLDAPLEEARLRPDTFRTSITDDWSAVTVDGDAPSRWGMLPLSPVAVKPGDHVNIIQHAGGGQKQISLFANVVVFVGGGRVQYLTDTLPGSSGSPVFDTKWNVVALHHSGGWLAEPNATSKSTYWRNEGIAIERVIAGLGAPG